MNEQNEKAMGKERPGGRPGQGQLIDPELRLGSLNAYLEDLFAEFPGSQGEGCVFGRGSSKYIGMKL